MRIILAIAFGFICFLGFGNQFIPQENIDILHYSFQIEISDETDEIIGKAQIQFKVLAPVNSFFIELHNSMKIEKCLFENKNQGFKQADEKVNFNFEKPLKNGIYLVEIQYHGIPKDGLIISKTKFNNRTFFGDNWPNRAHHYLPCIDHPSDKATVEFKIIAPAKYQVVANGVLKETSNLKSGKMLTTYTSNQVLPTKVMVFAAAEFSVDRYLSINGNNIETWVYPENKKEGFYDYALAAPIVDFFEEKLGEYPYDKLANVQSKTRYGGMENAGCIFYFEGSVTGKRDSEELIAHEVAHQWFGNSASEKDWEHIWLSEGFATYLTGLYLLENKDFQAFGNYMEQAKQKVYAFYSKYPNKSVIPENIDDLNALLNPLSYQKGAWVLHMLNHQYYNGKIWELFKQYHEKYKYGNATTQDFFELIEANDSIPIEHFKKQWLYSSTIPELEVQYNYNQKEKAITFQFKQLQKSKEPFVYTLDLAWLYPNSIGKTIKTVLIDEKTEKFTFQVTDFPGNIEVDPLGKLLVRFSAKD